VLRFCLHAYSWLLPASYSIANNHPTYTTATNQHPLTHLKQASSPAFIVAWFLFGIQPLTPGFGSIAIKPQVGTLKSGMYILPTVRGPVTASFSNTEHRFELEVTLPPSSHGVISVPLPLRTSQLAAAHSHSVVANSNATDNAINFQASVLVQGVMVHGAEVKDGFVTFEVVSGGTHMFVADDSYMTSQMEAALSHDAEERMPILVELDPTTTVTATAAVPTPPSPTALPFDIEDANRTLHLAYAAFCNESAIVAWNCQWCTGTNTYEEPLEMAAYLKDTKTGTQGYVGIDHPRHRVVVSYRGSKNLANGIEDADFILTKLPFGPGGLKVHTGFLDAYESLRNATAGGVQTALSKCGSDCSVLFTGHSLGAAMATIAAAEHGGIDSPPVRLFTFGCPRVGNAAFVSWAHGRLWNTTASVLMRRQKDIVPAIPPRSIGYVHMPGEVWNKHLDSKKQQTNDTFVICNGSGEDPACGDSEEHPPFPLDLIHLSPAEHTRYMGFQGGNCWCGTASCE
jgi:hypothetical protein